MPEAQEILCETCGKRPARLFLTQITSTQGTAGRVMNKASLCEACANEGPTLGPSIPAMKSGCSYCGTPALAGGGYGTGGSFQMMCRSCSAAGYQFILKSVGANSSEEFRSVLKKMSPEAKAEALRDRANVEEFLRTRRVPYETEVYSLVQDAVGQGAPLTAADLLEIIRVLAIERFGTHARAQLAAWGVTRSEDFGEIAFRLSEEGLLDLSPQDNKEDFSNGYDFESAFPP